MSSDDKKNKNDNDDEAQHYEPPVCFIDEQDRFRVDTEAIMPWFSACASHLADYQPDEDEIPFLVFLFGCEAALRCQQIDKIH